MREMSKRWIKRIHKIKMFIFKRMMKIPRFYGLADDYDDGLVSNFPSRLVSPFNKMKRRCVRTHVLQEAQGAQRPLLSETEKPNDPIKHKAFLSESYFLTLPSPTTTKCTLVSSRLWKLLWWWRLHAELLCCVMVFCSVS